MIELIRERLKLFPFQPFALRTADGREYPVLTIDHIWLPPGTKHILVANDEGITVAIPPLLVTGLVQAETTSAQQS